MVAHHTLPEPGALEVTLTCISLVIPGTLLNASYSGFQTKPTTRFGNKEKPSPSSSRKGPWNVLPSLATCSFHSFHPIHFPPCLTQDTSFILEPSHPLPRA